MVDQVQIPHSVVEGREPLPSELVVGGLAVNLKDRLLYTKGYDGVVIPLNQVVSEQIINALGFAPAKAVGNQLPAPAHDLATVISLANDMRVALINSGIGT